MKTISTISELRKELSNFKSSEIGFVPTMGALHEGHLSLIENSVKDCRITICSIFVNPTQFNNQSDLDNYPITVEKDSELLKSAGCDFLFLPTANEIYKEKTILKFDFGHLENVMEGAFRPGHFNGVATIVSKLFNIVKPGKAYFGKKDFQQLAIIKQLVSDLNFDIEIKSCETKREDSGLAMSSRNQRLTGSEKVEAAKIYESLQLAKKSLKKYDSTHAKNQVKSFFNNTNIKLEYIEIVDSKTLKAINNINESKVITICLAAHLGNVRLIDNITI